MDHYSTLGVEKNATADDIKRAYRKLASKYHPDKGGDTAMFQKVEEAYRTLSDPDKRAAYDNPQQNYFKFSADSPDEFFNIHDIFSQFGFNGRNVHQAPRRNHDIRVTIQMFLSETLTEQKRTLNIKTNSNQPHTVDVTIPAGVTAGTTIRYPNLGDHTFTNLPRGSLLVDINIINNTNFEVNGLDITQTLTVSCFDAILGSEHTITGLDGRQFIITTPKYCQPDTRLKVAGEGLPAFQKDIKGNMYVKVKVFIPKNLSDSQLEEIRKLTLTP